MSNALWGYLPAIYFDSILQGEWPGPGPRAVCSASHSDSVGARVVTDTGARPQRWAGSQDTEESELVWSCPNVHQCTTVIASDRIIWGRALGNAALTAEHRLLQPVREVCDGGRSPPRCCVLGWIFGGASLPTSFFSAVDLRFKVDWLS